MYGAGRMIRDGGMHGDVFGCGVLFSSGVEILKYETRGGEGKEGSTGGEG